jgi:aspartate/glutamate racemase
MNAMDTRLHDKPAIVLGGGIGPMAGTLLHQAIIRNTPDVRTDAVHLDIVHLSLSSSLPDRTAFLMGRELRNPGPVMAKAIVAASTQLALAGRRWLAALPCCTFHTPAIFDAFLDDLDGAPGLARVVHLVDETVAHLLAHSARPKRIGVLSTEGSHRMGLWRDPLRAAGFDVYDMTAQEAGAFHAARLHRGRGGVREDDGSRGRGAGPRLHRAFDGRRPRRAPDRRRYRRLRSRRRSGAGVRCGGIRRRGGGDRTGADACRRVNRQAA